MRYSPEYMHNGFGNNYMGHMPFFAPGFGVPFFLICLALVLALKGYCLWHASKRNEKWWFIALLVINTMGLLELVYIIFFLKKFHTPKPQESHNHEHHHDHNHEGHSHQ